LRFINTVMWFALVLLTACAPHKTAPKAGNFPVVVPFALDRKGSTVTVEFELPNALDPYFKEPTLRPVFIGVRRVSKNGDLMTDAEFQQSRQQRDYLQRNPVPVRLALQRWEQGKWQPVTLYEQRNKFRIDLEDSPGPRLQFAPFRDDGIVRYLGPSNPDNTELIAIGQRRDDRAYAVFHLAQIMPPTPTRYRLTAESMEHHALLQGLIFELLVSHHYNYGITHTP
jgi:hypothetical protein